MSNHKKAVVSGSEIVTFFKLWLMGVAVCGLWKIGYRENTAMLLTHGALICLHLYVFGVKRFTVGNVNGFDLLFGIFYLYFWWQNPWGFMFSYIVWGYTLHGVLRLKPVFDETSA
jgi:hypothetical protein